MGEQDGIATPAVMNEIGGVKVHVVSGDYYASEKILDRGFLRDLQRNLGAEMLAAPYPRSKPRPAKNGFWSRLFRGLPSWVKQLVGILLVASFYFGTRGCSRWQTSREARSSSVEALTQVAGAETAHALVDRPHDARSAISTPTPEPDYGRIALGDFEVTLFKRLPNVQLI